MSVLVVEVPPQQHVVSTSAGLFLRRALGGDGRPACVPMDAFAVQSQQADRGLLDPSAQIVPTKGPALREAGENNRTAVI